MREGSSHWPGRGALDGVGTAVLGSWELHTLPHNPHCHWHHQHVQILLWPSQRLSCILILASERDDRTLMLRPGPQVQVPCKNPSNGHMVGFAHFTWLKAAESWCTSVLRAAGPRVTGHLWVFSVLGRPLPQCSPFCPWVNSHKPGHPGTRSTYVVMTLGIKRSPGSSLVV